jgi:hypothetical protein
MILVSPKSPGCEFLFGATVMIKFKTSKKKIFWNKVRQAALLQIPLH